MCNLIKNLQGDCCLIFLCLSFCETTRLNHSITLWHEMKIYCLLGTSELYIQLNKESIVKREIMEGDGRWLHCFEVDETSLIVNIVWRKRWISRYQWDIV